MFIVLPSGCQKRSSNAGLTLPSPLISPPVQKDVTSPTVDEKDSAPEPQETTTIITTPPPLDFTSTVIKEEPAPLRTFPNAKNADVNFHDLPLPAFINEVYGNLLGVSFEIDPKLAKTRDLITLRTGAEQTPWQLDKLARQVLENYGVTVKEQDDLMHFLPSGQVSAEVPLLISGRALPEVPKSHRQIFQLVPLTVVRNNNVKGWLSQAFKGQELEIMEDPHRNAILLRGAAPVVEQALEAINFLDQPYMRGRHSIRIQPLFLRAQELAELLVQVLKTEGYSASLKPALGSIIVLPVESLNTVLVFAAEDDILDHVKQWAINLDKPGRQEGESGLFFYDVQNTTAANLGLVVNEILGSPVNAIQQSSKAGEKKSPAPAPANKTIVVDKIRNSIIFRGDPKDWQEILNLIRHFDKPPKQVLIEVTIAEISLTEDTSMGIEWIFDVNINNRSFVGQAGILGGLGIGGSGFSFNLNSGGQTKAMLNAFASQDRVNIVSTPRIMVKSGNTATIDVGTDVPTITSQQASSDLVNDGNTGILQNIEYRKTGTLLSVTPSIYSGNQVDLEVSQEMSEVSSRSASEIKSPSILTRKINTSLTLRDGGSVLLGGLIYNTSSDGSTGIPLLMDIPWLGQFFRVDNINESRTMLIMLIVPYIVENDQDAKDVTEAMKRLIP